jgi:nitroreductase
MEAIEALKTRRSVRQFKQEEVPGELIETIVECGSLAASAINIQPWEFVVVTDGTMRQKIAHATDHGMFIAEAPVCIAVFCRDTKYYLEDGCAATQNILVAARASGLGSCWVAGEKKPYVEKIRRLLGVPEGYHLISLVALGYSLEVPKPSKRPLSQLLHWESF